MTRTLAVAGILTSLSATVFLGACSSKAPAPEPDRLAPSTASPVTATSPTTTTPPAPPERTEHGGLADCLKSHGVTDAGGAAAVLGPPAGVDQGTWDSAMKECSALGPGPGPG